jgi:gluconolactonase
VPLLPHRNNSRPREEGILKKIALLMLAALAAPWAGSTLALAAPITVNAPAPGTKIARLDPALDKLIAPGTAIRKLATGFVFVEGPLWHDGALWFSDLRGNRMYKATPDGKITMLIDHAGGLQSFPAGANGGSNAMVEDRDGTVLMNQHGARRIVRIGKDLKITPFLEKYQGKRLNSPNDLIFGPDGALWITDPPYGFFDPARPNADLDKAKGKEIPFNGVYRYKDGKLTAAITNLTRPNGIGFSPDGRKLYVSNTEPAMQIHVYDVAPDGKLSNDRIFADLTKAKGEGVPDGLRIDAMGNIWASGPGGIRIFNPAGKLLGQIQLPEVAANVTFGGPDRKTVYIMGSTSIYTFPALVAGEQPRY